MAGHFFETWVFLGKWLFLDIDSIHQVAKYWFWHILATFFGQTLTKTHIIHIIHRKVFWKIGGRTWNNKNIQTSSASNLDVTLPRVKRGGIISPKKTRSFLRFAVLVSDGWKQKMTNWSVVSTHLKNIRQSGNLPQVGVNIKNIWNHHLANFFYQMVGFSCLFFPTKKRFKTYLTSIFSTVPQYFWCPLNTNLIDSIQSSGLGLILQPPYYGLWLVFVP